jgi:catechol 1,2-dioxygenase
MLRVIEIVSNVIARLVDEITFKKVAESGDTATASAILGPFWRHDTPIRANGDCISSNTPDDGVLAYMYGTVTSAATGEPLKNASVDIWQASTNGK